MKFNRADNKIYIIDCWITQVTNSEYKLLAKPMRMKNAICIGVYINDIEAAKAKNDILLGHDDVYGYMIDR